MAGTGTDAGKDDPCRELTRQRIPAGKGEDGDTGHRGTLRVLRCRGPPHCLEIHNLSLGVASEERDPADLLLVLCGGCHRSIHREGPDDRIIGSLADARPARTRLRIRRVLEPRPYSPPDCGDAAKIFSLAVGFGGTDLFLNGA